SERWDSLRLLTPRWQSRLPGWRHGGAEPDGFMSMPEITGYLTDYARSFDAPVSTGTTVQSIEPDDGGYRVRTDRGAYRARAVVIATGHCDVPHVPAVAGRLDPRVRQLVPSRHRRPDALDPGGVLVVGASASGVQLADEIHRSGRRVTLAVGRHLRMPRRHLSRDVLWWLDRMGVFDQRLDELPNAAASLRQPSMQLVGRPDHASLDLATLQHAGVRLVGRVEAIEGHSVRLSNDLERTTSDADDKLARLLDRIDAFARSRGLANAGSDARPARVRPIPAPESLDLRAEGIRTVLWATGYRRRYPWLRVPVLDARGEIRHRGGITAAPGLYVIGLFFMRKRKSSFIDGVGDDARDLTAHLAAYLRGDGLRAA
ncbi:MAG: NAD(P)-binding domain-containing protein, partial [Deltaproteobacteria bacterium]|nr:NAD(P)-binding domain-containing protein [Deltaproteobacteria bacterium]